MESDGAGEQLGWEEVWEFGGAGAGYDGGQLVESAGEFVICNDGQGVRVVDGQPLEEWFSLSWHSEGLMNAMGDSA